jgi:hypothetical protein
MVAGRGRLCILLFPELAIPFPGFLAAFAQFNRPASIQDKHISFFIVSSTAKDAPRGTILGDSLPLLSIPAPDRKQSLLAGVCDTIDQKHLM